MKSRASFRKAIREESIQYPGLMLNVIRVFHILDSLQISSSAAANEAKCLHGMLLNHFKDAVCKEGHVSPNVPQVIYVSSHLFVNS